MPRRAVLIWLSGFAFAGETLGEGFIYLNHPSRKSVPSVTYVHSAKHAPRKLRMMLTAMP